MCLKVKPPRLRIQGLWEQDLQSQSQFLEEEMDDQEPKELAAYKSADMV